jgi:DHA1 family bicyclomycin/chloramphenicol resistance-like MFS transporter
LSKPKKIAALSEREFIPMTAMVISLVALSIDAMLPALPAIAADLRLDNPNDAQLIVGVLLLSMGVGTLVFGPLSDSIGRKPAIYGGFVFFIAGSAVCIFSQNFEHMLIGRALQGFGCAAPRIVMVAVVRDQYSGNAMARIMSFVMSVFILVPAIAPALGAGIMLVADWRAIFIWLVFMAIIAVVWVGVRQPETLPMKKRTPYRPRGLANAAKEVVTHPVAVGYTLASGFIFVPFIGYLSSSQQVFAEVYDEGERFPLYFAILALAIGVASVVNGKLVMRYGMKKMVSAALKLACVFAVAFALISYYLNGAPPLYVFMLYFTLAFFCNGILFSNLNALAMEPLGHIAGMGAAIVNAFSTLISVPLGAMVGLAFDGSVMPLAWSFMGFTLACAAISVWAGKQKL